MGKWALTAHMHCRKRQERTKQRKRTNKRRRREKNDEQREGVVSWEVIANLEEPFSHVMRSLNRIPFLGLAHLVQFGPLNWLCGRHARAHAHSIEHGRQQVDRSTDKNQMVNQNHMEHIVRLLYVSFARLTLTESILFIPTVHRHFDIFVENWCLSPYLFGLFVLFVHLLFIALCSLHLALSLVSFININFVVVVVV